MNNNAVVVLVAALVSLQNMVAALKKGRITLLSIFSGQADEDVHEFVRWLEIVFLANQIMDNRKFHIEISYLTGMAVNWYELN